MSVRTKSPLITEHGTTYPVGVPKGTKTSNENPFHANMIDSVPLIAERQYEEHVGDNWTTAARVTVLDGVEQPFLCNNNVRAKGSANAAVTPFWNITTNKFENLTDTQRYLLNVRISYNATAPVTDIVLVARTATTNVLLDEFPIFVEKGVDRQANFGTYMLQVLALAITEGVDLYLRPLGGSVDFFDPVIHFECDHEGLIDL